MAKESTNNYRNVASSNIKAIDYNTGKRTLEVIFHSGGKYAYPDVPKADYRAFLAAKSKGKYFHKNIRPMENYTKVAASRKPSVQDKGLQEYQQRVVNRMKNPNQSGLLVYHGTGTGKSRTAIETQRALGMPTTFVTPASLQENVKKEYRKWYGGMPNNVNIESQQAAARFGLHKDPKDGLLIVDESQGARDSAGELIRALKQTEAKKRLLLSATPIFNRPHEIAPQINLAAGKKILPEDQKAFDNQFVQKVQVNPSIIQRLMGVKPGEIEQLKNKETLRKIMKQYVDYHPGQTEGFPEVKETTVKVPMGAKQMDVYNAINDTAPWWQRQKVKWGLPPGKGELDKMQAFLSGARQVSNTNSGYVKNPSDVQSTKINKAFEYLNQQLSSNPRYKAVVYSNYLNNGLYPYKELLNQAHIPYGEFNGAISDAQRQEMVRKYNENKLRALLISSAGSAGLDLKGTRLVQILEPHFNEEKERQIIGRGARYQSHANLPANEQNVLVQRYLASPHPSLIDRITGNANR